MTDHFTQHLFERVWWNGFWEGAAVTFLITIIALQAGLSRERPSANPIGPEVRAEITAICSRLMEIESDLIRVMQLDMARNMKRARWNLTCMVNQMEAEEVRLEGPSSWF